MKRKKHFRFDIINCAESYFEKLLYELEIIRCQIALFKLSIFGWLYAHDRKLPFIYRSSIEINSF